jgi:hypothetical protein
MLLAYPALANAVLKILLLFPKTCCVKQYFQIKSKYRNRINAEDDLQCALS